MSIKQSLPRASAMLLVCALMVILFNVSTMMSNAFTDKSAPKAIKGQLDLSKVDLTATPSLPLSGTWEFYWQQLLTPEQIATNQQAGSHILAPLSWLRATSNGQKLSSQGFATYHLEVQTDKKYQQLSLKIPTIGTAYRLYVDNKMMSTGGQVGTSAQNSEPGFNAKIVFFEPKSERFSVTVQVSNFDYNSSGMWQAIRVGESNNLQQQEYQLILRSAFLLAIFLTVALFNLIQFTLRSVDPLPVLIAITCFMLGLREIGSSQILSIAGLVDWSFVTHAKISYITFYATTPLMVAYFHMNFLREYKKSIMTVIYLICIAASLLVLLSPPVVFSRTLPYFQGLTIIIMPYVFWGLVQAVRNHRHGARLLMLGTTFLFVLVINDILLNLAIIDTTLMVSFGLVAFVLCQNYLTYIRFIDAGIENELLSETLEERNQELQDFSQSLEEKVAQRTNELAEANEKLGELAHQDMLTGLPNRRGMMGFIEEVIVLFKQNSTPFCLLLIDFDRFKQLNDSLGHEVGDKVLSEGATLMRQVVRVQDKVARWGGEEFLILLPGTPIKGAQTLAEKVKNTLRDELTEKIGSKVSVTIGVAEFTQDDTLKSCFKRADDALYQGKHSGRDKVVLATIPEDAPTKSTPTE